MEMVLSTDYFFLFLYDLGPFSSYARGPICPTWFTKYGKKEWCLFQILVALLGLQNTEQKNGACSKFGNQQ